MAAARGLSVVALYPARSTERQPPHTIEPELEDSFRRRRVVEDKGRYVVPIKGARLTGPFGLVVLPDKSFAAESVVDRMQVPGDPNYYLPRRPRPIYKRGDYFSLVVKFALTDNNNYYHWLHDSLQRLHGVQAHLPPGTAFIVPPDLSPTHLQTLHLLGLKDSDLLTFRPDETWELETLHFAPQATFPGHDRLEVDAWLRDRLMAGLGLAAGHPHRRIFISRRSMSRRRLANEDAVAGYLQQRGFEICLPELLSFREQVELFSQASAVVATHGSGFTNTLFAPPGLTLVDMVSPSMTRHATVFWSMAEELGHHYWYFMIDTDGGPRDDGVVDLDKLASTLDGAGL